MALVYGPEWFTEGQQSELAGMRHLNSEGVTFAHEQHSRPQ